MEQRTKVPSAAISRKKRRTLGVVVATASVCVAAVVANAASPKVRTASPPPAGTPVLTLMTYNVNYGLGGDPETAHVIRDSPADLIVLQETTPEWERTLRAVVSTKFPHMLFEHTRYWAPGGMAVLSKRPILHADPPEPSPVGWFFGWRVEVDTAIGTVQVLNVHLRPPLTEPSSLARGYFSTPADRLQEIQTYAATLKSGMPTFVVGDFNEGDRGDAIGHLRDRGLDNALSQFQPGATTWRWPVGSLTARTRLDHILYDASQLDCFSAEVLPAGRSDHFPVVARFVSH
jgi:endonuclease/exonuclease/phosphatase (EEP) superfamily protein YafD